MTYFISTASFFDLSLSTVRLKRQLHLPLVITVHALVQHPNPIYGALLGFADRQFIRRLITQNADEIIAPDKDYQEFIQRRYERKSVALVPYGVEYPLVVPELDMDLVQKYGLDASPLLVSLGHVHEIRDRCDLIRAMKKFIEVFPTARLVIIGEIYTQKPVTLVHELGLEQHVIFTGPLPRKTALGIVQRADMELHWAREGIAGLGIASLESMAMGKAVMAHARTDLLGDVLLTDWEDLVIAPRDDEQKIADALIRLFKEPGLREKIARNGQRFIQKNYSWDAVCDRMENIYSSLIKNNH